jgi:hypothetical protein
MIIPLKRRKREDSGDTTNRVLCFLWNEKYHALGGLGHYRYMGNEKPEFVPSYSTEERDKLIKSKGHKLSGLNDKKRDSLCRIILDEIRKEAEARGECGAELHLDSDVVCCASCGKTFWMKKGLIP